MNLTFRVLSLLAVATLLVTSGSLQTSHAAEPPILKGPDQTQAARDYFFYICVHQYFRGEDLDKTDVSVGYQFEYLSYNFSALMLISTKAKRVADSLKASQHPGDEVAGGDWRQATVLATCLEESRKFKVPKPAANN